ncbi:uncharacterized protein [Euwallacea similis]|uniref:uncharacterized protein n=1 Tax=Euwallacea similis TaxID=1736056 RepID=UPI003450B998
MAEHRECDKRIEGDNNESLEEKCWQEEYKGHSRKWLIRDASAKSPQGPLCSTMKESYLYPERENTDEKNMGGRRKYLMKKFLNEATEELRRENEHSKHFHYCTEYDVNFKIKGFNPEDDFYKKNTDQFQKHPLYSSTPVSYYSYKYEMNPKDIPQGLTKVTDRVNIFKRYGRFSKPITESYDFVEL